ncbi:MAG: tetratricopeptide repeat protein [Acidobacteriota bacterium]
MKILFLAANPVDVISRLRTDEEFREISQKIHSGSLADQFELIPELAVRPGDLQAALLRHQPDIVHFSGHGSPSGGIILENETGKRQVVSREALADLFRILKDNLRVVVLNACYAKDQAQALTGTIDFTIGMSAAIDDRAAIVFAAHFYQSLAFGRSVKEAFELAVNELCIEGFDVALAPELLVRDGANAAESRIGETARRVALAEDEAEPALISEDDSHHPLGRPVMRGATIEEHKEKPGSIAFLPWLFASIAISLATDVLRRFLGDGWSDMAALIVQSAFVGLAIVAAAITTISMMHPTHPLVVRGVSSSHLYAPQKVERAVILTGIALVLALTVWLSLPVFARYYNESGAGFQYREQPDLTRARESYQQAVRLNPSYAPAHYNLAFVQEDLQPEKAIAEYLLAIRYDSDIYPAYNNLARLYLLRGQGNDYENALNILSQAVVLSPQDENVQYSLNKNLGWANYALKHYPLAETYLRRAISLRSQQGAAAHCLLAYVLKEQGKAGAVDECYDCVSLAPGEKDLEAKWVSDAQDCLLKGGIR